MTSPLVVQEYAPARGAAKLDASPDGKFLALELNFVGAEAPSLVKVIERASGRVVSTGRGFLVSAPDDSGEAFYVSIANPKPELRSTARASLQIPLDGPADSFWRGHRSGGRLLVLHEEQGGASLWVGSIDTAKGVLDNSKKFGGGPAFRFATSTADAVHPFLYLSVEDPTRSGEPYDAARPPGFTVAIDATTLAERWRAPWQNSDGAQYPALGLSGDGQLLAAYSLHVPQKLQVIDTSRGQTVGAIPFVGPDEAALHPADESSLLALRYDHPAPGAVTHCDLVSVALPSGTTTKLWEKPRESYSCPYAFTLAGTDVLLAPRSAPRYANDRSSWGPEVLPFIK